MPRKRRISLLAVSLVSLPLLHTPALRGPAEAVGMSAAREGAAAGR